MNRNCYYFKITGLERSKEYVLGGCKYLNKAGGFGREALTSTFRRLDLITENFEM